MSKYSIYEGGNRVGYPWEPTLDAERTGIAHGEYAAHLKVRDKVLQFHWNRSETSLAQWFTGHGKTELATDDEVALLWLLDGTQINGLVFHNKVAVPGTTITVTLYGGADVAPIALSTPAEILDAETTVITTVDIDLTEVGYTVIPVPAASSFLQSNGEVTIKLAAGVTAGTCFTVSASLTHHNDQHPCTCAPVCCDTEYPEPNCVVLV